MISEKTFDVLIGCLELVIYRNIQKIYLIYIY